MYFSFGILQRVTVCEKKNEDKIYNFFFCVCWEQYMIIMMITFIEERKKKMFIKLSVNVRYGEHNNNNKETHRIFIYSMNLINSQSGKSIYRIDGCI